MNKNETNPKTAKVERVDAEELSEDELEAVLGGARSNPARALLGDQIGIPRRRRLQGDDHGDLQ